MAYKIIFFGTSDFSVPSLHALLNDSRFKVVAVVTKPDVPVGRHQTITPPPVKVLAQEHDISVYQFDKVKTEETYEILKQIQDDEMIDAYVVVSYGKILPQRILDLPQRGCINVHGSLLPRWRGASCIQSAIAAGDKISGVTIMLMDSEMDHGDILTQVQTDIAQDDTGGILHDRLAQLGADTLPDALIDYLTNEIAPKPQDHSQAVYCKLLTRDDGKINWSQSAEQIERLIRAYNPWPGTWTEYDGKRIKITRSRSHSHSAQSQSTVTVVSGQWLVAADKILIKCGDDKFLEILELQPEGKKIMTAKEYLAGHAIKN